MFFTQIRESVPVLYWLSHKWYQEELQDFSETLDSLGERAKDESTDEVDITEISDDTSISDEDFTLDENVDCNNIDILVERAKNALTSV